MRVYCFDLDGTICTQEKPENYPKAIPNMSMIQKINKLYDEGNVIYIYTARHMHNERLTKKWFKKHNIKYHHIFFGKPAADLFVDDRSMTPDVFLKQND